MVLILNRFCSNSEKRKKERVRLVCGCDLYEGTGTDNYGTWQPRRLRGLEILLVGPLEVPLLLFVCQSDPVHVQASHLRCLGTRSQKIQNWQTEVRIARSSGTSLCCSYGHSIFRFASTCGALVKSCQTEEIRNDGCAWCLFQLKKSNWEQNVTLIETNSGPLVWFSKLNWHPARYLSDGVSRHDEFGWGQWSEVSAQTHTDGASALPGPVVALVVLHHGHACPFYLLEAASAAVFCVKRQRLESNKPFLWLFAFCDISCSQGHLTWRPSLQLVLTCPWVLFLLVSCVAERNWDWDTHLQLRSIRCQKRSRS